MLFYKDYVLRRFEPSIYVNGHSTSTFGESTLPADVQTLDDTSVTADNGTRSAQRIKIFSKLPLHIADQINGVRADWIYFQDKWFEVKSCRLSENTLLKHYTSEAAEIPEAEIAEYLKAPVSDVPEEPEITPDTEPDGDGGEDGGTDDNTESETGTV